MRSIVKRHAVLKGSAALVAGLLYQQMPAMAQGDPSESAEGVRREAGEQVSRTAGGPSLSERANALPDINYSDVLAAPDDPAINLRYVKDLVAKGNVQLAAATTERILLQYPEADDVRLLYAILLYRMDVLDEASVQLDILEQHNPPGNITAEIARYRKLIQQRLNPLKRSASLSAGMHYDTNRNSYPNSDTFLVGDRPFMLPGNDEEDDIGRIVIGAAQISKDTGAQQLQQIFADVAMLYDDQVEFDSLDARALLLNGGFVYKTAYGDLIPRVHASWIELDREKYSRDYAVSLRGQRPLFESKIKGFAQITHGWRNFNNTTTLPFSSEQDGHYQRLEIGGDRQIDATTGVRLTVALNNVDGVDYEAYNGYGVAANLTKVLPRGTFLLLSASFEKQFYDGNDPFISAQTRNDLDFDVDLTYGVPVTTLVGLVANAEATPGPLQQIVLNLTAGYQNSDSNLPNYDYENFRGQFMFNRNWDF